LAFKPEFSWEFLPADQVETRTIRALRNHVLHVREVSPYYRETLRDFSPDDITTLEIFHRLPFTTKDVLADQTKDFLAVSQDEIVETVVTSGSTGKPLVFSLTANDLERLAFNEALSFNGMGVTAGDRVQILVSLDRLFIAGMAYYRGLTHLGANTARIGVLPIEMQLHYIDLLKPTVLVGVPSFLKKLGTELDKQGFKLKDGSIKKIACIGESIRTETMELNATSRLIEEIFGAKVYSTYASTELSCAYCECTAQNGGHAHPELLYTEIVDEKGEAVPDGAPGELVATTLGVEGMPLVRYRTGDITFKIPGACSCGRTSMRIGPILSRKSQLIKLKGTTVYPLTITNVLDSIECVADYVIMLEGDESLADEVTIHIVAPANQIELISGQLRTHARVNFPLLISNIPTIQAMRGDNRKKMRVIDKRRRTKRQP
jgi:phenylacetate-CoA ligase